MAMKSSYTTPRDTIAARLITSQLRVMPESEEDASGALQASALNSVIDTQFVNGGVKPGHGTEQKSATVAPA